MIYNTVDKLAVTGGNAKTSSSYSQRNSSLNAMTLIERVIFSHAQARDVYAKIL